MHDQMGLGLGFAGVGGVSLPEWILPYLGPSGQVPELVLDFKNNVFGTSVILSDFDTLLEFSRPSLARLQDNTGKWVWCPNNYAKSSERIAGHASQGGSLSNDPAGITHPDGLEVFRFLDNTDNTRHRINFKNAGPAKRLGIEIDVKPINGNAVETEIFIAGGLGGGVFGLRFSLTGAGSMSQIGLKIFSGSNTITALEDGWYRITLAVEAAGSTQSNLNLNQDVSYAGTGSDGLYISRVRLYEYPAVPDYMKTVDGVSSPVFGPRALTHDILGNPLGFLSEQQSRNRTSQPDVHFWSTRTNITTSITAPVTGPDGVPDSATKVTATANNGTIQTTTNQVVIDHTAQIWLKRLTGTGTIEFSIDNGISFDDVTAQVDTNGPFGPIGFARIIVTKNIGNMTLIIRLGTSGDEIGTWGAQVDDGLLPLSALHSRNGFFINRLEDDLSIPIANFPYEQGSGTLVVEGLASEGNNIGLYIDSDPNDGTHAWYVIRAGEGAGATNGNEVFSAHRNATDALVFLKDSANGDVIVDGASFKVAMAQDDTIFKHSVDGGIVASSARTTALADITALRIGSRNGVFSANAPIGKVVYYSSVFSDSDLEVV